MKRIFLWAFCGVLFFQSNVFAQQSDYSHWSAGLRLGLNKAEYVGGFLSTKGLGLTFGVELERTFNPLWGLAVAYDYLGYSHKNVDGKAHELTGLASLNLANLVERYRRGNWQRLNVYGRLGAGFSLVSAVNKAKTVVMPIGASIEYNITPQFAVNVTGDRRWHMSSTMGFAGDVQDRAVHWVGTVGLRYKFGTSSRHHIRNTSITVYEAPYTPLPEYDNTFLQERIDRNDGAISQLQEQLDKTTEDLNKAIAALNDASKKITFLLRTTPQEAAPQSSINSSSVDASTLQFENIEYGLGKTEIPSATSYRLDILAAILREYPNVKIEVVGYTDNLGYEGSNKMLSLMRAEVVKAYLLGKGADATRITVKGLGDANPVVSNDTPAGRRKNRRVEVHFFDN